MLVLVLNGVNLARLGAREPEVYGSMSYDKLVEHINGSALGLGLDVDVRQTDSEQTMVSWLHEASDHSYPVVINPGAWTHYSHAIGDAAREVGTLVEVHVTNIYAREEFRHLSVISPLAQGVIAGLGWAGYDFALGYIASQLVDADGQR
ncbi:MAG: 3-dehydroquinate dehydratase [Propionibacteriaceae bacterium]|nr:3-dehydroquinate dehydratase [Propionibacteriaceae bacterium]